ncbi:tetraspanin-8-like [Trifolium medium]|uniref:Tetraspanin-8-like n=1 Tax=Trifolium medium TaxID=97028 RepID=A0A392NC65_9FABA|nr:tetraspanin-8-like [Trifolium medium]
MVRPALCIESLPENGSQTACSVEHNDDGAGSGCCKPSNDCSFTYQNPTTWTKTKNVTYTNPDCDAWNNDSNILCFDCKSCKAGLLQTLQTVWNKVYDVTLIILIFLAIVSYVGYCAFMNNRRNMEMI